MRRMRPRSSAEAGLTLIELLVSTMLMAIVSSLVVGAVIQASRVFVHTDDENRGLADAKVILDRLGRDVRESRGVVCDGGLADPTDTTTTDPSCRSHLQLWVDANSDYAQQADEVITWRLQRSVDGEHYDVWRAIGPALAPLSQQRIATSLWTQFAFAYDDGSTDPASGTLRAQEVIMRIEYDAIVGRGTMVRQAAFTARLRNKGTK